MPAWSHTGTPAGLPGFGHLTVSATSGSAAWISARSFASVSPRQSPSPLIFASIASAAIASSSHFLAGQRRGLLHPVGERRFVDLVVLMDMEIARIAAFRRDRRHRIERLHAKKGNLYIFAETGDAEELGR